MAHIFKLHEHNFQNVAGDRMTDMDRLSAEGWEIESSAIGFPIIHVLWRKDVDAPAQDANHAQCQADLAQAQAAAEAVRSQANTALSTRTQERDQALKERDEARDEARQLRAENGQLKADPPSQA